MAVDGLIIPRSYNDYFSRTEITQFNNAVKATTDAELNPSSAFPVQNKAIAELVPTQASSTNKLADKEFVNSSVSTNTANYINDNGEPFASVAALEAYSGTVTNNDYAFVTGTDSEGNTYYDRYKATVNGASVSWAKEYRLNNSSFTAAQWDAIQSGITAAKVAQYDAAVGSNTVVPVGTISAYYGSTDPADGQWLICDGRDTTGTAIELETHYPSLYMFLGGTNVLPEIFDHSRPSAWETITGVQVGYEMPYDGIITASGNWNATGNIGYIAIDGVTVGSYGYYPSGTQNVASGNTITVKKGQKITAYVWASQVTWKASWYKSHKLIKAVSSVDVYHAPSSEIAQIEQYFDNGLQNAESYSTTETLTGGKWIDGKPIYRKVWTGLSVGVSAGSWQNLNLSNLPSIDTLVKGAAIRSVSGDKYIYNFISFRWTNSTLNYKSTNAEAAITEVVIEYTKTTD